MRNLLTLLALAVTVLPTPVLAREAAEQRFSRDGATYVYTVQPAANGSRVIAGRRLPSGAAFRLVVRGDRVDGQWGGQPVAFRAARTADVKLAAR